MPKISELVAKALRQKGDAVNGEGVTGEGYGRFLIDYVISGAELTNNATSVMVSAATISFETDLYDVPETTLPVLHGQLNKTLYVDFTPEFGFRLATAHPTIGYLPLYELVTDATGNVVSFTDKRGPVGEIRYRPEFPGIISDSRSINAGSGLTGGGDLKQDRTISIADGGVTDTHIGNRTADQTIGTAAANSGTLTQLISWVAKQLKAITGAPNWYDAPTTTIASLDADKAPLASPGFTGTPTAPTPALEDSSTALATTEFVKTQPGFLTADDKAKLAGISAGAEVNQNAFSKIAVSGQADVDADTKTDALMLAGGTGITITTDAATDTVTITATGEALPGPHASSHITGGTDVIPDAVAGGDSGLMSGADKSKLDGIQAGAEVNQDLAAGANITLTPDANTVTIAVSGLAAVATSGNASDLTEDASNRFVSDTEKAAWNAKAETTDLVAANPTAATMTPGVQIINSTRKSRLKMTKMTGRTLVNLIGRSGGMESMAGITTTNATISLDSTNKVSGANGLKIASVAAGVADASFFITQPDVAKTYLFMAKVKNGNATNINVVWQNRGFAGTIVTDTTKFTTIYYKVTGSPLNQIVIRINTSAAGQYAFVDEIALYELSAADATAIDTMTAVQVTAKYPYVDDLKSVNAVYAKNVGKNLLPPLNEWTNYGTGNSIIESYKGKIVATAANFAFGYRLPCAPNQSYTLTAAHNGVMALQTLDEAGNVIDGNGSYQQVQELHITTTNTAQYLNVLIGNGALANGTYNVDSPMLNIGTEALLFEPQKPSYLYLPDVQLRSNVDGSVADTLFIRDEQPRVIRRFREVVLDGSLPWGFSQDHAGYKRLSVRMLNSISGNTFKVVKHGGKILAYDNSLSAFDTATIDTNDGNLYVTVSDTDSGWTEAWNGTTLTKAAYPALSRDVTAVEMLKAYFNGWVWLESSGQWYARNRDPAVNVTSVVDTVINGYSDLMKSQTRVDNTLIITPYHIVYQLLQPYEDAVSYEGDLFVHDGANQIEVGTGIVVREAAKPYEFVGASVVNINDTSSGGASKLSLRTNKILGIYEGTSEDKRWAFVSNQASGYGGAIVQTSLSNYNKIAAYAVTYLALDTYALGLSPASISAEYAPNVKEALDDIALAVTQTRTQVSALQATKAGKQPGSWIAATLINGWMNYDAYSEQLQYMKDELGFVTIRGFIRGGTVGAVICTLPPGYRPGATHSEGSLSYGSTAGQAPFRQVANTGGNLTTDGGANTWMVINVRYKAEL